MPRKKKSTPPEDVSAHYIANNPGRYDVVARLALLQTEAEAVLLIVVRGKHGNGYSEAARVEPVNRPFRPGQRVGPDVLREIADAMDRAAREEEG